LGFEEEEAAVIGEEYGAGGLERIVVSLGTGILPPGVESNRKLIFFFIVFVFTDE
jgi:hypothetical protein